MRDEYVGYLIGAIDEAGRQAVEAHLQSNIGEHHHEDCLRTAGSILINVRREVDVPHGLALRTCALVRASISSSMS